MPAIKNVRERVLEKRLREGVEAQGHRCIKIARLGWPDRLIVLQNGIVHWVEMKRPKGGVLSPPQIRIQKELNDHRGFKVFCLYTQKDVDNYLHEHVNCQPYQSLRRRAL